MMRKASTTLWRSASLRSSSLLPSTATATATATTTATCISSLPSFSSHVPSSSLSRSFATGGITKPRVLTNPPEETPLTETIRDFLPPAEFYQVLKDKGMDFYTGVPDSLLKDFCAYVTDNAPASNHVITANEGAAVALATGYYLGTRKFPIVYMQNSGYGNAVNPLLSLADPKVYSIPMLLLIGWRGEPGKKDEPQHIVQGKVMSSLLTDMNIQFEVLPDFIEGAKESVESAIHYLERRSGPYAFLVKRQTFQNYKLQNKEPNIHHMTREDALRLIVAGTGNWDVIVSTTGFTSRELYELREEAGQDHRREFLTVGSMGHSSAIALGIAMSKPSRQIICVDGDGALLMHMGTMATVGISKCENFKHILINNGSHDSVGGQPTRGFDINFTGIAKNCGYRDAFTVSTADEIKAGMQRLRSIQGPVLMEVLVNKGARKNLGRPTTTPVQNKIDFMGFWMDTHVDIAAGDPLI